MCLVDRGDLLDRVRAAAGSSLDRLGRSPDVAATSAALRDLLVDRLPLVHASATPLPDQLTTADLLRQPVEDYPGLLQRCVGPPLTASPDALLGRVAAECALTALRRDAPQSALAALFLVTLTSPALEEPEVEAWHHLLLATAPDGSRGLLTGGALAVGTSAPELAATRRRYELRFVTTAVQLLGSGRGR